MIFAKLKLFLKNPIEQLIVALLTEVEVHTFYRLLEKEKGQCRIKIKLDLILFQFAFNVN